MKDQYDRDVPNDLVILPNINDLDREGFEIVVGNDWYEINGILMASAKAIEYLSEADPLDAGIDLSKYDIIDYVANALKRWNEIDGFYHA